MPNFKIVRKGYDPYEVDGHITEINNELLELKNKENYINKAMISAEIAADDLKAKAETEYNEIINQAKTQAEKILAEAKEKSEKILTEAKEESERLISKTHNQISLIHRRESDKMNSLKLFIEERTEFLESFNSDYLNLVNKYFETPHNEEFEKLRESLNNITALIDNFQNSQQEQEQEQTAAS